MHRNPFQAPPDNRFVLSCFNYTIFPKKRKGISSFLFVFYLYAIAPCPFEHQKKGVDIGTPLELIML